MRLLRTPIQHIVIGEVIIDEGSAIMIRIKKPQTGIYEDITLGQLLTEMAAPLQGRTNAFLLTPVLHIKIGELLCVGKNTAALRIKKPRTMIYEVITIDELLLAVSQLAAPAA